VTPGQGTLIRFLIVGGGMALVFSVLAALATAHLPVPDPVASAGAWVLCIPLGYLGHRRFTFPASKPHRHALWLYTATQALSIGIVAALSHLFARGVFGPDLALHLVASALAAAVSFVINRWVVFPAATQNPGDRRQA
jgi:putative flippase GtrA